MFSKIEQDFSILNFVIWRFYLTLKLQDSSFTCKPNFIRRKKVIFWKLCFQDRFLDFLDYFLFHRVKEVGCSRQGGTFNNDLISGLRGKIKKFQINTFIISAKPPPVGLSRNLKAEVVFTPLIKSYQRPIIFFAISKAFQDLDDTKSKVGLLN